MGESLIKVESMTIKSDSDYYSWNRHSDSNEDNSNMITEEIWNHIDRLKVK